MAINRPALIKGPARVEFNSGIFFSQGDVLIEIETQTLDTTTSKFGTVDKITVEALHKVRFTPVGEWENLATLFPLKDVSIGASVFGSSDTTLKIVGSDGEQWLYTNAAVTKEPDVRARLEETLLGELEFSCMRSNDTAWSTTGGIVAISSVTPPSDTEFSLAAIKRQAYTGTWGTAWEVEDTESGFLVQSTATLTRLESDGCGSFDFLLSGYDVVVTFTPVGGTSTAQLALMKHQGTGATRGQSLAAIANDFLIAGDDVQILVRDAALVAKQARFSAESKREGEVRMVSTRRQFTLPVAAMGTDASPVLATPDDVSALANWWKLDEASGSFVDSKGTEDLSRVSDAVTTTGLLGNAVNATGGDGAEASPGTGLMGAGSWSVTGWVNLNANAGNQMLIGRYLSTGNQRCWALWFDDYTTSVPRFQLLASADGTSTLGRALTASVARPDHCWHFVACGWDSSANQIWIEVNRGTRATASQTAVYDSATAKLSVGFGEGTSGLNADARMDNFTIHKAKLTTTELDTLYNAGRGVDGTALAGLSAISAGAGDSKNVWVVLGDSVALGRKGDAGDLPESYQRNFADQLLAANLDAGNTNPKTYDWQALAPVVFSVGSQSETPSGGHGLELGLGRELAAAGWSDVGIAKYAVGGSEGADDWSGDAVYTSAETWVNARLAELNAYTVRGVVVCVGTNDADSSSQASALQANLTTLLSDVRTEWGATLPVVLVMPRYSGATYLSTVQTAVSTVAAAASNNHLVDTTSGTWTYTDGIHPDSSDYINIGREAAAFFA